MKQLFTKISIFLILLFAASAVDAHTTAIFSVSEANGSTTFYARSYHSPVTPRGGLIVGGVTYNFTVL
jgi:hypothetical protein